MKYISHHTRWLRRVNLAGGWNVSYKYGEAGFNSQTRYVTLIKVGFKDSNGRKQFATYTTANAIQTDVIVRSVVSIQIGSAYVYGGPNA